MSMPWNYFIRRRGVNIESFLKSRNCQTYEDFCKVLAAEDIEPPPRKEMEVYFAKVKKRNKPAPKKQMLGTKPVAKTASRHTRSRPSKAKGADKPVEKPVTGKDSEQS